MAEPNECGKCHKRVSEWMMASGKTTIINGTLLHKACLNDMSIADIEKLNHE